MSETSLRNFNHIHVNLPIVQIPIGMAGLSNSKCVVFLISEYNSCFSGSDKVNI